MKYFDKETSISAYLDTSCVSITSFLSVVDFGSSEISLIASHYFMPPLALGFGHLSSNTKQTKYFLRDFNLCIYSSKLLYASSLLDVRG